MKHDFDVIVIGSGTAASTIAKKCRAACRSVAIIEKRALGGTCVLRGCDPKKILRRGPEIIDSAFRMASRGIEPEGLRLDWPSLVRSKASYTGPIPEKRRKDFEQKGIEIFYGTARFGGENQLNVADQRLTARNIVIAAGAKPRPLAIPGEELITTSTGFMELAELPRRIAFIGGGLISFEFAHIAARAGSKVTVLTRGGRPLGQFDPDLVDGLVDRSRKAGIDIRANTDVTAVKNTGSGLEVCAETFGKELKIEADLVVHGAGRVPAIDALDLEKGNVKAGKKGIDVNRFLQSVSNPAVYAAGDVAATAGPPLTPVSSLEGKIVAENLINGNRAEPDYTGVPSVVFTIPALARVGLLEKEAKEQKLDYRVKFSDMSAWYSVMRVGETHAAAKTLIENGTDRILGAHLFCPESSELINMFALAIRNGLKSSDLKNFISAYPSAGSDIGYLV